MIIKNARIVSPTKIFAGDVLFSEKSGVIELVAPEIQKQGEEVLDAEEMLLLPGCVDMHVHFRDPGFTHKEDFSTGTRAALAGGVTTVADMPNNQPPTSSPEGLKTKKTVAVDKALCDYAFYYGANENNLGDLLKLAQNNLGVVAGAKVFMSPTTGAAAGFSPHIFKAFPKLVAVHAEDEEIIKTNEAKFREELGESALCEVHNKIRSPQAAAKAASEAIGAAEANGGRLHICHVSTEKEVELVTEARKRGVRITCEVTPHHLFLSEEEAREERQGNFVKVNPPLRSEEERQALWKALLGGEIDCVASDHAPHLKEEKQKSYWQAPSGVPGVETMLPLLLDAAVAEKISLEGVVELLSANPAQILGLEKKGAVEEGKHADFVLVDVEKTLVVKAAGMYSKCGWTPYEGIKLRGKIERVFLRGREVFDGKRVCAEPGFGRPGLDKNSQKKS